MAQVTGPVLSHLRWALLKLSTCLKFWTVWSK